MKNRLCILFCLLTSTFQFVSATHYYVNDGFSSGDAFCTAIGNNSNTGLSPSTPKLTLRNLWNTYGPSGTNVLSSGDTIFIDAGTYSVTGFASVDEAKFDITVSGLTFLGAGAGLTIFDHNFHGGTSDYFMWIKANNTTLKNLTVQEFAGCPSCSGVTYSGVNTGGQAITVDNATQVLIENVQTNNNGGSGNAAIAIGPNSQVVIRGGGSTCNATGGVYSGGIDVLGTNINLLVENYVLAYNSKTAFFGSALYVFGDNTTTVVNVKNSRIVNNEGKEGTGLYVDGGRVTVRNSIISNNIATGGTYGGGVTIYKGVVKLANTTLTNNAGNKGGGVAVYPLNGVVTLELDSCLFSGNTSTASRGVDLYARPRNATNTFTITANQTTFSTTGNVITLEGTNVCTGSSITLTNSGNPPVQNISSFCAAPVFMNTTAPAYTPVLSPPNYSGVCGSIIILPVELLNFAATTQNNYQVNLIWRTATEVNNDYFVVEKSNNALVWEPLGRIHGAGNSNTIQQYQLIDFNPGKSNYYRLQQFDLNGAHVTYPPIYIELNENENNHLFDSYPNPAQSTLYLRTQLEGNNQVQIMDLGGRVVVQENIFGIQTRQLDVSTVPTGIYYLQLSNGDQGEIKKLIIQ
jgi:hypothetical protein